MEGHLMGHYFLWDKGKKIYFQLPEAWQVLHNVVLESKQVEKTITQMVSESIAHPVGTLPLQEMIKPTDNVVVIVDDFARPTPRQEILKCLVQHLEKFGLKHNQINILFGIGTHRPLSEKEAEEVLGRGLFQSIQYCNHDCWSKALVSIGRLKTGGEVRINPLLLKANVRIGIGSVIPHPMNGFGGGAKIIMPGVVNYEAIREHHISHMIAEGVSIGNTMNNPFYEEICEVARLAKLDFIINSVYNSRKEVMQIVSGHFKKAHQFGVDLSLKEYAVEIGQKADVSIVSTFPFDEGPQILKSLVPATLVTKKGGTVILVASIRNGKLPDSLLDAFDMAFGLARGDPKQLVMDYLKKGKLIVENAPMDFNCALDVTLLNLSCVNVIFVSDDVNKTQAERLGCKHSTSIEEAIRHVDRGNSKAKVNILPVGGLIVPIVKQNLNFPLIG